MPIMDANLKLKLIDSVRKNPCIYNWQHKDYRNNEYKGLLWEKIGASLNVDGRKAKEMWRSLRDNYKRHKKHLNGKRGGRKYQSFVFLEHFGFLDEVSEPNQPTKATVNPLSEDSQHSSSIKEELPVTEEVLLPLQPEASWTNSSSSDSSLSSNSRPTVTKKKKANVKDTPKECKDTDKDVDYQKYDAIDHLFLSYSKTFKTFSLRKQVELKVNLAKLFADAELQSQHH